MSQVKFEKNIYIFLGGKSLLFLVLGVENISLYDVEGRIKENQDKLLLAINTAIKEPYIQYYNLLYVYIYLLSYSV